MRWVFTWLFLVFAVGLTTAFADSMVKNIPFSMHEAMKRGVVFATILTPVLYFTQRGKT